MTHVVGPLGESGPPKKNDITTVNLLGPDEMPLRDLIP